MGNFDYSAPLKAMGVILALVGFVAVFFFAMYMMTSRANGATDISSSEARESIADINCIKSCLTQGFSGADISKPGVCRCIPKFNVTHQELP